MQLTMPIEVEIKGQGTFTPPKPLRPAITDEVSDDQSIDCQQQKTVDAVRGKAKVLLDEHS